MPYLSWKLFLVRSGNLRWIKSLLECRKQQVVIENCKSTQVCVISGVTQGKVFEPSLILVFINDLPEAVHNSTVKLLADDCILFKHIKLDQDAADLKQNLSNLEQWKQRWQMKFHPQKCTVIRIGTNNEKYSNYTLHGHTLEVGKSSKYLGVNSSEDLQWKQHQPVKPIKPLAS